MPFPFRRSAATVLILATVLTSNAGALSNTSNWAADGVAAAESRGLAPEKFTELDATKAITRAEFCGIIINVYKEISGKTVFMSASKPFKDSSDPNVTAAYELGIVNGSGNSMFHPDDTIKRQDMCVMFSRVLDKASPIDPEDEIFSPLDVFPDSDKVDDYARHAMETMLGNNIINGVASYAYPEPQLQPYGIASREQALIMSDRFCSAFSKKPVQEEQDDDQICALPPADSFDPEYGDPEYYIPSNNIVIPGTAPIGMSTEEKMQFVYGGGDKYQSSSEAEAHMTEISINVWHLNSDGSKTPDVKYITVNSSLANTYKAIFDEIYNGPEKFPINDIGCYSWRTGEHSQGTAVDINPDANMEAPIVDRATGATGAPTCGTHWTPYIDPLSIPENGDVYNAFTKYGFGWGGNAWRSKRDYMHFSFFST